MTDLMKSVMNAIMTIWLKSWGTGRDPMPVGRPWWLRDDAGVTGESALEEADVLVENLQRHIAGLAPEPKFDGHANCFIESGYGKAFLIDFNYDTEPLPGKFPLPGVGPLDLLKETEANHWGKLMFRWVYWNLLLKGVEIPIESQMTMLGKWN